MSQKTWTSLIKPLVALLIGIPLIHLSHKHADRQRFREDRAEERFFLPNPQATKALSMGQQTMVSDLFWIRTVLIFADFAWDCQDTQARWLVSMVRTMSTLDPSWRTLYMYGGNMLGVCNKIDEADEIFALGHENLPEDYYFPFSLAMNAYQEHKDYESAEKWMRIAVEKEGAPTWYRAAMAGVIDQKGQRAASIRYLEEELKKDLSAAVRDITEERLRLLMHEVQSEELQLQKERLEDANDERIWNIERLQVSQVDPWGDGWMISADGKVRAIEMERREAKKTRNEERHSLK